MPVHQGRDSQGPFYQFGSRGAKYRYTANDAVSRLAAKALAERQGRAEHARKSAHR